MHRRDQILTFLWQCSILMVNTDTQGDTDMFKALLGWFQIRSYGRELEEYIIAKNPKDLCDIERLSREYNWKISQGSLS